MIPLLSICIPTYNREKCLKELLDSIIYQDAFSDKIEILIYDDPSTDNTQSMIQVYMEKYKNIHYYRNNERLGMMPSILNSILKCSGKYIWLFGSDDIMGPFGLQTILSLIQKQTPDLILNNYGYFQNIDYSHNKLEYHIYSNLQDFCNNFWKRKSNSSSISSLKHYVSYFSYMSIYCFRADMFRALYKELSNRGQSKYLLSHYFNYIYILFTNKNMKNIYVCENPILTYNKSGGDDGWTFNPKIMKDVKSLFQLIYKEHAISSMTKILFAKITLTWYKWFIISKISNLSFVKLIRREYMKLYSKAHKLLKLYR